MDHYSSWMTLSGMPGRLQLAATARPRTITQLDMKPGDTACVHVVAFDKLQNAAAERVACAGPLEPPSMPDWSGGENHVVANPTAPGLVGLSTWFWLAPTPAAMTVRETNHGIDYVVTAVPIGVDWDFGDGAGARHPDASGYGLEYPQPSSVAHTYEAHDETGYRVRASIRYEVSWKASIHDRLVGPYSLGTVSVDAKQLQYPVRQAQPELIELSAHEYDQPVMPSIETATTGPMGLVARYWAYR
jgi:hypothetical protein